MPMTVTRSPGRRSPRTPDALFTWTPTARVSGSSCAGRPYAPAPIMSFVIWSPSARATARTLPTTSSGLRKAPGRRADA